MVEGYAFNVIEPLLVSIAAIPTGQLKQCYLILSIVFPFRLFFDYFIFKLPNQEVCLLFWPLGTTFYKPSEGFVLMFGNFDVLCSPFWKQRPQEFVLTRTIVLSVFHKRRGLNLFNLCAMRNLTDLTTRRTSGRDTH